jgi:hypothetical protein
MFLLLLKKFIYFIVLSRSLFLVISYFSFFGITPQKLIRLITGAFCRLEISLVQGDSFLLFI